MAPRPVTAYLGPEGTFSHRAAIDLCPPGLGLEAMSTAEDVLAAVEAEEVAAGVVAFENSLEGAVTTNLDRLLHDMSVGLIAGERVVPVSFSAYRAPGDTSPPRLVRSHPFGLAQCSAWIRAMHVATEASPSTTGAVVDLHADPLPGTLAIGPAGSGEPLGLVRVAEAIENRPATTRFVLLRPVCPAPTGTDRTAFAVTPERDEPGSLLRLLAEFSLRGINLAVILSRPTREDLGRYVFYLECEGHLTEAVVQAAAGALMRAHDNVRILGTFPTDGTRVGHQPPEAAAPESVPRALQRFLARIEGPYQASP
jgi:prephenate dehydratase